MENFDGLTFRLESYLLQLSEINGRWTDWLARNEIAIFDTDSGKLAEMETEALALLEELTAINSAREQLLNDAKLAGIPVANLQSLARSLPAWKRPTLRGALATAKQQLSSIRRLHVATWVLISQRLHVVHDSMAIMMAGSAKRSVYTTNGKTESGGGQLLDASL